MHKLLLLCTALLATQVNAADITQTLNFTASGYQPGAPQNPVSGDVTWTWDPTISGRGAVSAINLSIDGYVYQTEDVLWQNSLLLAGEGGLMRIWDSRWAGNGLHYGTDDMYIRYRYSEGGITPSSHAVLNYITRADKPPTVWESTLTTVPLPASAWLFLSALGGLGIIKRNRSEGVLK